MLRQMSWVEVTPFLPPGQTNLITGSRYKREVTEKHDLCDDQDGSLYVQSIKKCQLRSDKPASQDFLRARIQPLFSQRRS